MSVDFYKEFGDLGYLANYSTHGFWKNGIYYKTVEHYYQAHKMLEEDVRRKIVEAETPKEASNIGRDIHNQRIPNINEIRDSIMYDGVLEKFRQNTNIRSKLIETRNQEIREMTVKESYWGVGPDMTGENHMGKILMKVREVLKKEVLDTILSKCKNKKVYVIGHANPDFDSVFSSLILTHVLKSMGIDAVFSVRDENFLEKEFIKDHLHEEYEVVDDFSDKYFLLVDHNKLDGIPKENVLGSIDHHIISGEVEDLIEMEYASTGLLLYDLFKSSYDFNEEERKLIALTVLADTEYLTSSRFGEEDRELYSELGVSIDEEEYQKKYFETTDFSKGISDNFKKNYKEYEYNGIKIKRSMISSYTDQKNQFYPSYILEVTKNGINLLIWCDYESKTTYVFYNGHEFVFPYFTTSTNLVIKYLEKEKYL